MRLVVGLPLMREHLEAGFNLLGLSPASNTDLGQWLNYRPFYESNLAPFLGVIDDIKAFLEGVIVGVDSIVSIILNAINSLKVRLAQLQLFIAKIKALIDAVLGFRLPLGLYATYHISNGTSGLVSSVTQAENKPPINEGIGTGLMMVGGGVPTVLVDLLVALMGGE